jgi:hypothetical protein
MDAQPQPFAPKELRPWTVREEHSLISLRDTNNKTFEEIGKFVNRTTIAVQNRYTIVKQRQYSSVVDWTEPLDASIINGRAKGQGIPEIASDLKLPKQAVGERWQTLQAQNQVPEEVLALWRRKEEVVFTEEEDEAILKLWIKCKDDNEIAKTLKCKGKSQRDIIARRGELVKGSSPIYLRLLGVGQGKENEMDGLKRAMGKPKYGWMK